MHSHNTDAYSINDALLAGIIQFLKSRPPERVGQNLRKFFLDNLENTLEMGPPPYFRHLLADLYDLVDLLELADKETSHWTRAEGDDFDINIKEGMTEMLECIQLFESKWLSR
jgi:hypothetical protein